MCKEFKLTNQGLALQWVRDLIIAVMLPWSIESQVHYCGVCDTEEALSAAVRDRVDERLRLCQIALS